MEPVEQTLHHRIDFSNVFRSVAYLFRSLNVDGASSFVIVARFRMRNEAGREAILEERKITLVYARELVAAVSNQRLHAFRCGFQMELEGDDAVVVDESLVLAYLAGGQADCAFGHIEGVAMPVESG